MMKFFPRHKGQIAVIVTLAVPVMVGVLALCCDVAVMYLNWQNLQKAADAGALAGATYLALSPTEAEQQARTYAMRNGLADDEITSIVLDGSATPPRWITVNAQRTVPHYLARVFGLMRAPVRVSATAQIQPVNKAKGLVPIGVNCPSGIAANCFTAGTPVDLKLAMAGPGNWYPVQLGAPGGNSYRNNIENGSAQGVAIGDWINTEPGDLVGPTQQGFNFRAQQAQQSDPEGSFSSHAINNQLVIELPLVNWDNVSGKSQVQVTGFAEFWITGVQGNGQVTGEFIQAGVAAKNTPDRNARDNGVYAPVLIK
jgi:Putative Flp pilus-assembly TadE/G-like